MPKSKKVDVTSKYVEADDSDKEIITLRDAFTFGIDERDNNPIFPYVISLSLRNDPDVYNKLKQLKKKYKVTEKLFYGDQEDLIYISLTGMSDRQRQEIFRKRCYVKAKIQFDQTTVKGSNVYMNLRLVSVGKVRDVVTQVPNDYDSDSE